MVPIFICGVQIQMPISYISLERKFYLFFFSEVLIENRSDIFLKVVGFFLKSRQDKMT